MRRILTILLLIGACVSVQAQQSSSVPQLQQWQRLSGRELNALGRRFLLEQHQHDSALACYTICANRFYQKGQSDEDLHQSISAMNNLGYMYFFCYYDYEKAYKYLQKSLEESERLGYKQNLPYVYLNMGNLLLTENESHPSQQLQDRTLEMYKLAFQAALDTQEWSMLILALSNMSNLVFASRQTELIKEEIDAFNRLDIPADQPLLNFTRHTNQAMEAFWRQDYAAAIGHFRQALGCIDEEGTPERFEMLTYANIAQVEDAMGQTDAALALMDSVVRMAEAHHTRDIVVEAYHNMHDMLLAAGDTVQAQHYRFLYLQAKDSLLNYSKLENVTELRFLDEMNKMDEEVRELSHRRQVQAIVTWAVVALAVLIGVILVLIVRSYRRLKLHNRRLYINNVEALRKEATEREQRRAYETELQQLKSQLEATELPKAKYQGSQLDDDEKRRIARAVSAVLEQNSEVCQESFSLERLAELTGSKYRYVSQVINETWGCNFNALVASCRIKEACRRLNDVEHYGQLTIEAVGASVGFKSRSNFVATFKRITGLSPSEYQRQAKVES